MGFENEKEFEEALINSLINEKGWKDGVLNYPDEKTLIKNWADIIFNNNREIDRLGSYPLTDGEMAQIMEQIKERKTPLKLNAFINGGNTSKGHESTVQIIREAKDAPNFGKLISLKIFERNEIAAGSTTYQIARQPKFTAKAGYPPRRGDFCLLINGMPVIHVELKKSSIPVSQAQYQIKKYLHEGVFTGLFSLVQIFVAMTPEECTYFANTGNDDTLNEKFFFHWADSEARQVNAWDKIAAQLLSIPMAHQMVGLYTVADESDQVLKVMRPYQYYAANAISDQVTKMKWDDKHIYGGYVWQTTGSGKTMTSFKSAQLIANNNNADKVVFLTDRIELGTQSLREYRGFADETDTVNKTENTQVLISKLKSDSSSDTLIVTSIQKMSRIREDESSNSSDIEKINRKRLVFIVDECHRSVFGEMLSTIKFNFPNAIFFGFSGTPILPSNMKKGTTTADVFGDELKTARYTIADGLRDGNVLAFDPHPQPTYSDEDLRRAVALKKCNVQNEREIFGNKEKEKIWNHWMYDVPMAEEDDDDGDILESIEGEIPRAQYDCDKHRNAVIQDITKRWMSQSRNGKYHAMLATSSIPEAVKYYQLFKAANTGLKITAVFDPHENNEEGSIEKIDGIIEILDDYNNLYGKIFNISNYAAFKRDVCYRLAHKEPYKTIEHESDQCLDLLIVVDQMLTGYDSKWLNTLYLDKFYDKSRIEMIIQAFSRTNRVFTEDKPHGTIRYYRWPYTMKKNIEYAFEEYSGNKTYGIFVLKLPDNLKEINKAFDDITKLFTKAGIENFERLPDEKADRQMFSKMFRRLNKHLEPAKVQGFIWEKLIYSFEENESTETIEMAINEETYNVLLQRYKELRRGGTQGTGEEAFDIDSYLMSLSTEKIDSDYMDSRFKRYIKACQGTASEEQRKELLDELHRSFACLSQEDQEYANILIRDIQNNEMEVDDDKTISDYICEYKSRAMKKRIHSFADKIGVDEDLLQTFIGTGVTEETIDLYGRFQKLKESVNIETAKKYFDSKDGKDYKKREVMAETDALLRKFILEGEFSI